MQVSFAREPDPNEKRVALIPEGVRQLVSLGLHVVAQSGAGRLSFLADEEYEVAGARIVADLGEALSEADLVLMVGGAPDPIQAEFLARVPPGRAVIGFFQPSSSPLTLRVLQDRRLTALAMELIPRITRAQSMDALSSMSTVAGYEAALIAASHLPRFFPMLMTAAGTIPPARVFVIGAGVAGMQAIATCKRLGAVVEAFDIRPSVREQIESLGARFVGLDLVSQEAEGAGGYAREVSSDTHAKELELIAGQLRRSDVVITTALVPGKKAPVLVTRDMLAAMKPGSVIVDLAAPAGGNCEATVPGETTVVHGVTVVGPLALTSSLPAHASLMYSRNVVELVRLIVKDGRLALDLEDEVVRGTLLARDGEIVHEQIRSLRASGTTS